MFVDVRLEELGENLIAMNADCKNANINHKVGSSFIMTYAGREFPGIFVTDSKDVNIEEITLYQTISMGIVVQTTENIRLHKVIATPRVDLGRMLSTGADSTHFVNCRGKIEISHCSFTNMMDDAGNVHGNYHLYLEREKENTLLLGFGHFQRRKIGPVEFFIIGIKGGIALLADGGDDFFHNGCHVHLRLHPREDLAVGQFAVVHNLNH
jgi:hypothetical protein